MVKIRQMFEIIMEDINNEGSIVLFAYEKMLHILFKIILYLGIPFLIYIILTMEQWS